MALRRLALLCVLSAVLPEIATVSEAACGSEKAFFLLRVQHRKCARGVALHRITQIEAIR